MDRDKQIYHKIISRGAFKKSKSQKENKIINKEEDGISDTAQDLICRPFYRYGQYTRKHILPISTRGLGFIIREIAFRLCRKSVLPQRDTVYRLTNALYRISLLQLNLKLASATEMVGRNGSGNVAFLEARIPPSFVPVIKSIKIGFTPITDFIDAIGCHKIKNRIYLPRHPRLNDASLRSPYFVNYENLRMIVEHMSDSKYKPEDRQHFYNHCPIPGARWVHPESPILINANDIMPRDYGLRHVHEDITFISNCADYLVRFLPNLINNREINWHKEGSLSQVVYSNPLEVRCPSFVKNHVQPIVGNPSHFWEHESLSIIEFNKGCLYLLGEDALRNLKDYKCVEYRNRKSAKLMLQYAELLSCNFNVYVD